MGKVVAKKKEVPAQPIAKKEISKPAKKPVEAKKKQSKRQS
jgi:hypothetical protein